MMYLFYYIPKNMNNKVSNKTLLYLMANYKASKSNMAGCRYFMFLVPLPVRDHMVDLNV